MAACVSGTWTARGAAPAASPCHLEASASTSPAAAAASARPCRPGAASPPVSCAISSSALRFRSALLGSRQALCRPSYRPGASQASAPAVRAAKLTGEDPEWSDDDYIVLGVAHCFVKDDLGKLKDKFVVEAIPAGGLECMDNGGATCYKHATATTLGVALKQDVSLLPKEFAGTQFCDDFDFRTKCASRTWKREHPQANLLNLVPKDGVRSDFNFCLADKRVLNMENVVNDSDNIKQDLSIDVYGRTQEGEEMQEEIAKLYSV